MLIKDFADLSTLNADLIVNRITERFFTNSATDPADTSSAVFAMNLCSASVNGEKKSPTLAPPDDLKFESASGITSPKMWVIVCPACSIVLRGNCLNLFPISPITPARPDKPPEAIAVLSFTNLSAILSMKFIKVLPSFPASADDLPRPVINVKILSRPFPSKSLIALRPSFHCLRSLVTCSLFLRYSKPSLTFLNRLVNAFFTLRITPVITYISF